MHVHACMSTWELRDVQVKEDVYEKMDKELLEFVEDVLLNRCENATERLLEYAATLDPKSKPCSVRQKGGAPVLNLPPKVRSGGCIACYGAAAWLLRVSCCATA
jgi:hypothetical protein